MAAAQAQTAGADKKLFTPGPLGVSMTTKQAMLRDLGSRDVEFVQTVKDIRSKLLDIAGVTAPQFTTVLQQGSGTFAVESVLTTCVPREGGKLVCLANGAYGKRICHLASWLGIEVIPFEYLETEKPDLEAFTALLKATSGVTNVAVVHCETSSGIINPIEDIGRIVREHAPGATYFVDAMSSFGAIPVDFAASNIDFLVSSANKCIEGVPGFGYAICNTEKLMACEGQSRSVSLDLVAQAKGLDATGQFRFTPATHTMLAFRQAIREFEEEGGTAGRGARYAENKRILREGMEEMGFKELLGPVLSKENYIITSYAFPNDPNFSFSEFYEKLNQRDLVIYPGKVTAADCFRIGSIGQLYPDDMRQLLTGIREVSLELGMKIPTS